MPWDALDILSKPSDVPLVPMDPVEEATPVIDPVAVVSMDPNILAEETIDVDGDPLEAATHSNIPWSGPILYEGQATGDGRVFLAGAVQWDEASLPQHFRWQRVSQPGHVGAIQIGSVDRIWRDAENPTTIMGEGVIFTGHPAAPPESEQFLYLAGQMDGAPVSVDADAAQFQVISLPGGGEQKIFSMLRVRGLTSVDIAAFATAHITMTAAVDATAGAVGEAAGVVLALGDAGSPTVKRNKKRSHRMYSLNEVEALVASGAVIPVDPPGAWFEDPKLPGPTPWTVLDYGQVFAHIALHGTCHTGLPGCVTPPLGNTFDDFHLSALKTAEGDLIDVGQMTFHTGHADMGLSLAAAKAHYDNTSNVGADLRAGYDEFGIWVAGALRPELTPAELREVRAAPLSGDWRNRSGRLELITTLGVNVPGFPVPRQQVLVASGEVQTFISHVEFDLETLRASREDSVRRFGVLYPVSYPTPPKVTYAELMDIFSAMYPQELTRGE